MRAEPDSETPQRVINLSDALVADVEGMDVYRNAQTGYLVVSSQGSDSYAVFDLDNDYALIGAFRIVANLAAGVDGVSETDGLAVTSAALPGYPAGIVVVQDGRNRMPDAPQNFKIVDWRALEAVLPAKH
jgi:3-phytase